MKPLKFTKRLLKSDFTTLTLLFLIWRVAFFVILSLALVLLPLQSRNFLGGGLENYLKNPFLFAWANFDGEHYLSIASSGYGRLNHSFFPLYPLLMSGFGLIKDIKILALIGLLISSLSFCLSLFLFFRLARLDYSRMVSFLAILLLLTFPTSFYFGAVYTESLFLFFALGSFFFARLGKWSLASLLGMVASLTRVTGIFLLPALCLEWWQQKEGRFPFSLVLIPLGLLIYLFFLHQTTGSFLSFYNELSVYGVQRQGNFILLPQVFFRYFKILTTFQFNQLMFYIAMSEVLIASVTILLLIYGFTKKIRWSYSFFAIASFILPTLTGSFSSIPRYTLVISPLFLVGAVFLSKKSYALKLVALFLMSISSIILTALFLRGYWVA